MEKEGGNRERMRKCRESISLHFLIFSPFPHSLSISSQPGCKAATIRAALPRHNILSRPTNFTASLKPRKVQGMEFKTNLEGFLIKMLSNLGSQD